MIQAVFMFNKKADQTAAACPPDWSSLTISVGQHEPFNEDFKLFIVQLLTLVRVSVSIRVSHSHVRPQDGLTAFLHAGHVCS